MWRVHCNQLNATAACTAGPSKLASALTLQEGLSLVMNIRQANKAPLLLTFAHSLRRPSQLLGDSLSASGVAAAGTTTTHVGSAAATDQYKCKPNMEARLQAVVGSIHQLLNVWVQRIIGAGHGDTQAQIYLYGSCALVGRMQVRFQS